MIRLKFESVGMGDAVSIGPAPYFRIGGNMIHQSGHRESIAEYKNHSWEVKGKHHTRYVCEGPSLIHFENLMGDATAAFGPFKEFAAADGVLHADGELLAKFVEETQLWHCFPTDTYWPTIVISEPREGMQR